MHSLVELAFLPVHVPRPRGKDEKITSREVPCFRLLHPLERAVDVTGLSLQKLFEDIDYIFRVTACGGVEDANMPC